MTPAELLTSIRDASPAWAEDHIIHALVVVIVICAATTYAALVPADHSGNVWIVYGSAIGYAAGRSGARAPATRRTRSMTDAA